jgi:hypothetical protein
MVTWCTNSSTGSESGNYDVIVGDRFMVSAHGYKTGMDTLKRVVAAVDLREQT